MNRNLPISLSFMFALSLCFAVLALPAAGSEAMFGFQAGLSTPTDKLSDVYHTRQLRRPDLGYLVNTAVALGYHAGMRIRFPVSSNALFITGISWHRFPGTRADVFDPSTNVKIGELESMQNVFPLEAGLNFYLLREPISLYAFGGLSYTMRRSSLEFISPDLRIPILTQNVDAPAESRVGYAYGLGIDLPLGIVTSNLEVRNHLLNMIGKDTEEMNASFVTVSLSVFFGTWSGGK